MVTSVSHPIVKWLDRQEPPTDFYELLGVARLDPDVEVLRSLVRQSSRALFPFQSHRDPQKAQRAIRLQLELGRAADILASPQKLAQFRGQLLERIRREWLEKPSSQKQNDPALRKWLQDQHKLHVSVIDEAIQQLHAQPSPTASAAEEEILTLELWDAGGESVAIESRPGDIPWIVSENTDVHPTLVRLQTGKRQQNKSVRTIAYVGAAVGGILILAWLGILIFGELTLRSTKSVSTETSAEPTPSTPQNDKPLPAANRKTEPEQMPDENKTKSSVAHRTPQGPIVHGYGELLPQDQGTMLYVKLLIDSSLIAATPAEFERLRSNFPPGQRFPPNPEQLTILRIADFELVDAQAKRYPAIAFVWNDTESASLIDEALELLVSRSAESLFLAPLFRIPQNSPLKHPVSLSWRGSVALPVTQRALPPELLLRPTKNLVSGAFSRLGPPPLPIDAAATPTAKVASTSQSPSATPKSLPLPLAKMVAEPEQIVLLPNKVSRMIDQAIVEHLTGELRKSLASRSSPESDLTVARSQDQDLLLRLNAREFPVTYIGNQILRYRSRDSVEEVPAPSGGELLRPKSDIPLDTTLLPTARWLLRRRDGWAFASIERILESLQTDLNSAPQPLGQKRAVAAAGCQILGPQAAPLTNDLVTLLESRSASGSEQIRSAQALASIGDPAALSAMKRLRDRLAGDQSKSGVMRELSNSIDQLFRKSPQAAGPGQVNSPPPDPSPDPPKSPDRPLEPLPLAVSQRLDKAIEAGLVAEMKQDLENKSRSNGVKFGSISQSGRPYGALELTVQGRSCDAEYVADRTMSYVSNPLAYDGVTPKNGCLLKLKKEVTLDGQKLPADRILVRNKNVWGIASNEYMIQYLGKELRSKTKLDRAMAVAGTALLGSEAEPFLHTLINILKTRSPESDEIIPAANALKAIGNPEALQELVKASKNKKADQATKTALEEAIKELRSIQKANGAEKEPDEENPGPVVDPLKAAESQFKLGKHFEDRKNYLKAKGYYEKVIELAPDLPIAKDAQERLDKFP